MATRNYNTLFWYNAVDLMWHLRFGKFPDDRVKATAWAIPKIYWTNLIKVGDLNGNTIGSLRNAQMEVCQATLREELKDVKPDIIILVSGSYGSQIVYSVFGEKGWHADDSSFLSHSEFEYKSRTPYAKKGVFWTRHPQGWSLDKRVAAVELISRHYRRRLD